ncbi:MAG: hypothetical protein JSY10_23830 [Paenibacillus sp.]|nr:hypothetical protein [Paenibacillus sp.]
MEGINRQVKYRSIPIGTWGGRIGVLCRDDMINMLTKFQPAVYAYFGKSEENKKSFDLEIAIIMKEMEHYKSFSNYYFYTAQKPHQITILPPLKRNYTSLSLNPKSF